MVETVTYDAVTGRWSKADTDPGSEVASAELSADFAAVGTGFTSVTGWSVSVPANSGSVTIWVPGGVQVQAVTGTNAATQAQSLRLKIVDESANNMAYSAWTYYGTGTSQTIISTLPLGCAVANSSSAKTYHVEFASTRNGTSGASGSVLAGGVFPNLTLQAFRR